MVEFTDGVEGEGAARGAVGAADGEGAEGVEEGEGAATGEAVVLASGLRNSTYMLFDADI